VPVIGASGIVSALMGGACRFAFSAMGHYRSARALPLLSIRQALSDRTVIFFVVIFFATNLLTASGLGGFIDGGASVAWQAHLGGFVFGFLGLAWFEPTRFRPTAAGEDDLRSAAD
jgi:membrane associated rhomboid family serine protease